jgi:hypothetical protein
MTRTGRAAVAALLLLAAGGCDLFATRAPEVEGSQESLWTPPTTPEIVVTNLELALEIGNLNDYQRALTVDFVFLPDAADVAQMEIEAPGLDVFEGWDRLVEVEVATTIRGGADSVAVDLAKFDDDLGQTVRVLKYDYVVTLFSGNLQTFYQGDAWFTIAQQPNGEWLIQGWEDVAIPQTPSWGILKGRSKGQSFSGS